MPENVTDEEAANKFWCQVPSIGEYNVQSYVCDPSDGIHENKVSKTQTVHGYALSGGGRSIQRVGTWYHSDESNKGKKGWC